MADHDETLVRSTGTSITIGGAGVMTQRTVGKTHENGESSGTPDVETIRLTERNAALKRLRKIHQEKEDAHDETIKGTLNILVLMVGMCCFAGSIPLFVYSVNLGANQPFLASSFEVTAFSTTNNLQLPFVETVRLIPQFTYLGLIMIGTGAFYFICLIDFFKIKISWIGYMRGLKDKKPIHTTIAAGVIMQLLQYLPLVACRITQGTLVAIIIFCGMAGIVCLACANSLLSSSISDDPKEKIHIGKLLVFALIFFYSVGVFAVFTTNIYAMIMNTVWYQHPSAEMSSYATGYMFASSVFNMALVLVILVERLTQRINIYTAEILKITLLLFTFLFHFIFVFSALGRPNILKNLLFQ